MYTYVYIYIYVFVYSIEYMTQKTMHMYRCLCHRLIDPNQSSHKPCPLKTVRRSWPLTRRPWLVPVCVPGGP